MFCLSSLFFSNIALISATWILSAAVALMAIPLERTPPNPDLPCFVYTERVDKSLYIFMFFFILVPSNVVSNASNFKVIFNFLCVYVRSFIHRLFGTFTSVFIKSSWKWWVMNFNSLFYLPFCKLVNQAIFFCFFFEKMLIRILLNTFTTFCAHIYAINFYQFLRFNERMRSLRLSFFHRTSFQELRMSLLYFDYKNYVQRSDVISFLVIAVIQYVILFHA